MLGTASIFVITGLSAFFICCALTTMVFYMEAEHNATAQPFVMNVNINTPLGPVMGTTRKSETGRDYFAFLGIPYAKPPIGDLRFKAPEYMTNWTETLNVTTDGPSCPQVNAFNNYQMEGSEDCLRLNVYSEKLYPPIFPLENHRPVMVYIHGGGFFAGSSHSAFYGPDYLIDYNVVVVTINYRLGPLGFLSTGDEVVPGNNGLKDQVMALKWVQENIAHFGGDPDRVTIFGESAGAGSTHLLQLSAMAKGLFHRAISQSGSALCYWCNIRDAPKSAKKLGNILSCPTDDSQALVDCLKTRDAYDIIGASIKLLEWHIYPAVIFGPVVETTGDNPFLSNSPKDIIISGEYHKVPWIVGIAKDEGAFLAAEILNNEKLLSEMNNNLDGTLPYVLQYPKEDTKTTRKIQKFYFHNKNISDDTATGLVDVCGDRTFIHCIMTTVELQSKISPVYFYQLRHRATISFTMIYANTSKDYGVSHVDDLMYLFKSVIFPFKMNNMEKELSHSMLALWTNFAKTGDPTPFQPQGSFLNWNPVTDLKNITYLVLEPHPFISSSKEPYDKRMRFWDSLSLD